MIPGVVEKVLASAVYDSFRATAKTLGKAPEDVSRAVQRAFDAAANRFFEVYGERHPHPSDSFISRASNWERVLESARYSAEPLTGAHLSPEGFNGAPTATEEELDFFVNAVIEAMAEEPLLDSMLAFRSALEHLARIAENTARPQMPGWTYDDLLRLNAQARHALDPYLLRRVPRVLVGRDYLPIVRDALAGQGSAILAVVGPAGFGKTTLLGQLYDELPSLKPGWMGVFLCADVDHQLATSTEDLSREMGRALTGAAVPLADVTRHLNESRSRGVLLIDTLDLILSDVTASRLRHILADVSATGTCVVFTCRDYEYDEYLAPSRDIRSGRAEAFLRHTVPWFSEAEVRLAARRLIEEKPLALRRQEPEVFAERLLELSADNRPLRHIVHNPLLLALLCELFDDALAIPADLTTSRLYDSYWGEKVKRARTGGEGVGHAKVSLCLKLAEVLFSRSDEFLIEIAREEELHVSGEIQARAYRELVSEGVYNLVSASGRLRFFHQTFLEYSIARWLLLADNRVKLHALLADLRSPSEHPALHWWQMIRQVLVLADPSEFDAILEQLDLSDVAAYRIVALAAVAAERADVLERLIPLTGTRETGFRKALLFALSAPSARLFPDAWAAALALLEQSEGLAGAMQAIEPIGELLGLAPDNVADRLREVLTTLAQWAREHIEQGGSSADHRIALGTFLNASLSLLEKTAEAGVLEVLREYYAVMGLTSKATTIRLHLNPSVPTDAREGLFRQMLTSDIERDIAEEAEPLFSSCAPWSGAVSRYAFWTSWQAALYEPLPTGWDLVRSRSGGRAAVLDGNLLRGVVTDLVAGDKAHIQINVLTLHAAILAGGGDLVCDEFLATPPESIGPERMSGISTLARHVARNLTASQRLRLWEWMRRLSAGEGSQPWVISLAVLADGDDALRYVQERLAELSMDQRVHCVTVALRHMTPETGSSLVHWIYSQPGFRPFTGAAETMRLAFRILQAREGDREALHDVIHISCGHDKKIAQAAAKAILEMAIEPVPISVNALIPLAGSKVAVVRKNALLAVRAQLDAGIPLAEADVLALTEAFAEDTDRMVVHTLCELVAHWMFREGRTPLRVGEIVAGYIPRLSALGTFDGGLARVVAFVFRVIAEGVGEADTGAVARWTRNLLEVMGQAQLDNAQENVRGLLVALGRRDSGFFSSVLELGPSLPRRALRTFVMAVGKVEGPGSGLLTRLVRANWCPAEIKRLVLALRGG
jgi:NACHT domain